MTGLVVIQPGDLNPTDLIVDPITKQVSFASTAFNNTDITYTTSAQVYGERALMFMPGLFVEHTDPTSAFVYAGIALTSADQNTPVTARRVGIIQANFWTWTPDQPVFIGASGQLTQTPPISGFSKVVGYALDFETIFLSPEQTVHLGG